jgi:hypothetical protein
MTDGENVPLLVEIPRALRVRVRVAAAQREQTIAKFVVGALELALCAAVEVDHATD